MRVVALLANRAARLRGLLAGSLGIVLLAVLPGARQVDERPGDEVNSLGIRLIRIPAGTFSMGSLSPTPESLKIREPSRHEKGHLPHGDWDEQPIHEVTISRDFLISQAEITAKQYRYFAPYYQDNGKYSPYVSGISWEEANAFCEWLTEQEGKPYRLPTEAEWEYACRAGTRTLFSSGELPPAHGSANPWGLLNMHTGVLEWCLDWYGEYAAAAQTDPVGVRESMVKVVRGGGLQEKTPYYERSANRGGAPPDFRGDHLVGFRIVQGPRPTTTADDVALPFFRQAVKQGNPETGARTDARQPHFLRRVILPIPPENVISSASRAAGFHPAILGHNHSPALEVCRNGDLVAVYFTSVGEGSPDVALIATRLRYGAEEWDLPELLFDLPDVNDVAPLLWNENGTLHLFWGASPTGLTDLPFWWVSSTDNGASWGKLRFPAVVGKRVGYYGQPINSAFRGLDGTIYLASDGLGGNSLLWASRDNGTTWFDTGGRTGGRHTCFALLPDGRIFGMGGKNTDIDGFMPQSISNDGGKNWQVSKSPFPALSTNQRPAMIRLASGNVFYAGDFQNFEGKRPAGVTGQGAFVALSQDEGKTWRLKTVPGGLPHEALDGSFKPALVGFRSATLGYAVARQAPDGTIHLLTSMNHPSLHFELNEAWILAPENDARTAIPQPEGPVRKREEKYADGKTKARWSGGWGAAGRYQLQGTQTFYYENGRKQWEASYRNGLKVGDEAFWTASGQTVWTWKRSPDGRQIWTQFWPNGQKKSQSEWVDHRCVGTATHWDAAGRQIGRWSFENGQLAGEDR